MNPEEIIAVEAMKPSIEVSTSKSANTQAMYNSAAAAAESSDGMNEAKAALDASVAKMMAEDDPFMQMMIAIYEVMPGTMLYKEEKLVYDTDTFNFVTDMNNHMTKMMSYYAKAGDYVATNNIGLDNESGLSTGGTGEDVWGLAAGDAYLAEMRDLQKAVEESGLPDEIKQAMDSAFQKIGLASSSSLWSGLAGPYRATGAIESFHQCDFKTDGQWVQVRDDHGVQGGTHYFEWKCNVSGVTGCGSYKRNCVALFGQHLYYNWNQNPYDHKYNCKGHTTTTPGTPGEYKKTVGDADMVVINASGGSSDVVEDGYSYSSKRVEQYQPSVNDSTTGNLELQTTINSYSATVEAEFMFDMEQYNTYANTNSQVMKAHIDQVAAPVTRLTHISHA